MVNKGRDVALRVLMDVNNDGAYSNIALKKHVSNRLNNKDRNLAKELVYGVLENKLYIDYIISSYSKIKIKKISPIILEILRMGVYQIVFMEKIPDRAAINEAVNLSKKYSHKGTFGYVNGVLRNISRNKRNLVNVDKYNKVDYLSLKFSYPKWLIKRWIDEYGERFTENLCLANNERPKLNIRVNTLKISREELKTILIKNNYIVRETLYAKDGLIIENPQQIIETKEFRKGFFTIQDESSMLVAQIMDPKENSFVLDICSAPGGKATHIGQIMNNKGRIICGDVHNHKLKLIQENRDRIGIDIIETKLMDGTLLEQEYISKFDYCLVDVPCTGLGLIRRRPDIKWNRKLKDIEELKNIQYKLLLNASKYIKSTGEIIYSTCTIEKKENIELIKKFLRNNPQFQLVNFKDKLCSTKNISTSQNGYVQLFPHIHNTDGFFIAKLKKNS